MGDQIKKKTRSFSLTDEEMASIMKRARHHGFDRSEYLLALHEADQALPLAAALHPVTNDKILRVRPVTHSPPGADAEKESAVESLNAAKAAQKSPRPAR